MVGIHTHRVKINRENGGVWRKVLFHNGLVDLCSGKITGGCGKEAGKNLFVDFDQIFLVVLAHTVTALVL